jgi:hypothetical protein
MPSFPFSTRRSQRPVELPSGVLSIAILFALAASYLLICGLIMLISPGAISMAAGAPLLSGLELAGPFMFLLVGIIGMLIAYGLTRLNNWARRAAIALAFAGFFMLIPVVSGNVINFNYAGLAWNGIALMLRVIVMWYLFQLHVREAFESLRT